MAEESQLELDARPDGALCNPSGQRVRRRDEEHQGGSAKSSGAITRWRSSCGIRACTKRPCSFPSSAIPASSQPRRWTAGAATSTSGRIPTRWRSTCSIAHHTHGRRSPRGASNVREWLLVAGIFLVANVVNCVCFAFGRSPSGSFGALYLPGIGRVIAAWGLADSAD